jgi:hypothetical protein
LKNRPFRKSQNALRTFDAPKGYQCTSSSD